MPKTIVVIEDNEDVRENIGELLEFADYKVHLAENGKSGIKKVKEVIPDLVLCDVMMPGIDGYGVINMLGKDPATSAIPFIFLTAKTEPKDIRKGMLLGADDYLTKPFDESDLLQAVSLRIQKSLTLKKNFNLPQEPSLNRGLKALENLKLNHKSRSYNTKETIYWEADTPNYLYFIKKGKVRCFKTDDYGKEFVVDIVAEGTFLGYTALLKESLLSETAQTMEDTEVVLIPKQDFVDLIRKDKETSAFFIKLLSNNIVEKERKLLMLAYGSVRERTADALLELADEKNEIQIQREDLAKIVGTATESLIRTLTDLKKSAYIEVKGRSIRILETEKLKQLAGV